MRGKEKSDLLSEAEVTEFDVVEIIAVCGGTNKWECHREGHVNPHVEREKRERARESKSER